MRNTIVIVERKMKKTSFQNSHFSKSYNWFKNLTHRNSFLVRFIIFFLGIGWFMQPLCGNPPYIPVDLTCTFNETNQEVTLTWEQPLTVPTGYRIYRDHEVLVEIPNDGSPVYSYTTTLTEYGIYAFHVRAYNNDGESDQRVHRKVTWLDPDGQASSLRQWGITWTFSSEVTFGQFANGDLWVVGPVNITNIDPACQTINDTTINGAMIDPYIRDGADKQGYDSRQRDYHDSLNVSLGVSVGTPLTINPGHSLISARSYYPGQFNKYIRTASVLTILGSSPAAGSFRPSFSSKTKSVEYNISDLDYGFLQNLAEVSNTPDIEDAGSRIAKVFLDHSGSDFIMESQVSPVENMQDYGRDVATIFEEIILSLNLDYPDSIKGKHVINFVQIGLDLYGVIQASPNPRWNGWGGHFQGRKLPVIFAGVALGDTNIQNVEKHYPELYFTENDLTYYYDDPRLPEDARNKYTWTGSKVLYKFNFYWDDPKYETVYEHLHPNEWTVDDASTPYISDKTCENYRVCCTAKHTAGLALAARLMGFMGFWDDQSYFDYADRWVYEDMEHFYPIQNEATGSTRVERDYEILSNTFARSMWEAYRDFSDTEAPTTPTNVVLNNLLDGTKKVSWNPCGDNLGCVGYKIYRDGSVLDTVYAAQSWIDKEINSTLNYQLEAFDCFGNNTTAVNAVYGGTDIIANEVSNEFMLYTNYPNPFNQVTTIVYAVPYNKESYQNPVRLIIYDQLGKEVATLVNEVKPAGKCEAMFDASNFSAGVYFCSLTMGNITIIKKIILVK